MAQREKMSKSRSNAISVDEAVYGVCDVAQGYEFRDSFGAVIDFRSLGVWRNRPGDGMYYTAARFGMLPVFLHQVGNPEPCILLIKGKERQQHG